ncbi:DUF4386 domain-containing protein [Bacillus carboniphilus]|uniref:DUF4386 domain-containing protein n=1 Tax=Bacillus carboniphilus TaxID=86663 RepID=A0ABY9JQS9_9BACI|nr:DUF4386 domain-containing protein [Bacillus carboniphilus]WLR41755.1 DUF4386 domain-containing protein [Bacillus carboniphilus]
MYSNKQLARIAGLFYLILIVCGVFAEFFVRSKLIQKDNASITAENILNSETLFRLGFVSDLMMMTAFLFLSFVLYILFKKVNANVSLFMVLFVLASVSILCINMLNQFAALIILNEPTYFSGFSSEQSHSMVLFFLDMHSYGYSIAQIFFGLWLLPLGYLVYKSRFFPRFLGVLLVVGCFSHLIDFFFFFLSPSIATSISWIVTLPADIAEFSFVLWLLIMGAKNQLTS